MSEEKKGRRVLEYLCHYLQGCMGGHAGCQVVTEDNRERQLGILARPPAPNLAIEMCT
jgi:hypothetical protein